MRVYLSICSLLLVCFVTACGPGKTKVDPSALTGAFGGASTEVQGQIASIVTAVTANDYEAALGPIRAVVTKGKMTPEQTSALSKVLADMQRVVVENEGTFTLEVYNQLSDLVGMAAGNAPINM